MTWWVILGIVLVCWSWVLAINDSFENGKYYREGGVSWSDGTTLIVFSAVIGIMGLWLMIWGHEQMTDEELIHFVHGMVIPKLWVPRPLARAERERSACGLIGSQA